MAPGAGAREVASSMMEQGLLGRQTGLWVFRSLRRDIILHLFQGKESGHAVGSVCEDMGKVGKKARHCG